MEIEMNAGSCGGVSDMAPTHIEFEPSSNQQSPHQILQPSSEPIQPQLSIQPIPIQEQNQKLKHQTTSYGSLVVLGFGASLHQISFYADMDHKVGDMGGYRMELRPRTCANALIAAPKSQNESKEPLLLTSAQLAARRSPAARALLAAFDFVAARLRPQPSQLPPSPPPSAAPSRDASPRLTRRRLPPKIRTNLLAHNDKSQSSPSSVSMLPSELKNLQPLSAASAPEKLVYAASPRPSSPATTRRKSIGSFMSTRSIIASTSAYIAIKLPTSPKYYAWYNLYPSPDHDAFQIGRTDAPGVDFVVPGRACIKRGTTELMVSKHQMYDFRIICSRIDPGNVRIFAGRFEKGGLVCGSKTVRWMVASSHAPIKDAPRTDNDVGNAMSISQEYKNGFDAFPIGSGLLLWRPIRDNTGTIVSGKWMEISVMGYAFEIRDSPDVRGRPIDPRIFPDIMNTAASPVSQGPKMDFPSPVPHSLAHMYAQLNRLVDGCIIHSGDVSFLWKVAAGMLPSQQQPAPNTVSHEDSKTNLPIPTPPSIPKLTRQDILRDIDRISTGLTCPITLDTISTEHIAVSMKERAMFKNFWLLSRLRWLDDLRIRLRHGLHEHGASRQINISASTTMAEIHANTSADSINAMQTSHDTNIDMTELSDGESIIETVSRTPAMLSTSSLSLSSLAMRRDTYDMDMRRPWFFSNCGHVFSLYDPRMKHQGYTSTCSVCRTNGTFVPLSVRATPTIITGPLEYAFDPCGHMIDAQGAKLWATVVSMPPVPEDPRVSDSFPVLKIPQLMHHRMHPFSAHRYQQLARRNRHRHQQSQPQPLQEIQEPSSLFAWPTFIPPSPHQHPDLNSMESYPFPDLLNSTHTPGSSPQSFASTMTDTPPSVLTTHDTFTTTTTSLQSHDRHTHFNSHVQMDQSPLSSNTWGPCCPFCNVKILGARKLYFQNGF